MKIEITMTIVNKACSDKPEEIIKQLQKHVSKIKEFVFRFRVQNLAHLPAIFHRRTRIL